MPDFFDHIAVFAFFSVDVGSEDHHLRAFRQTHQPFADRLCGLCGEHFAAFRAVRDSGMGVKQAQIVVNFGYGRYGGTRIGTRGTLFDGDCGGEPFDVFDLGLLHPVEELARISGKTFDIAPLSLGIQRIESQRRFSRAAEPGDHGECIPRNPHVDRFEIVLFRAFYDDIVFHDVKSLLVEPVNVLHEWVKCKLIFRFPPCVGKRKRQKVQKKYLTAAAESRQKHFRHAISKRFCNIFS